ncbi:hypothetical protein KDW_49080 [Dictyobacter vulcani]|uniref:Uncharacterized protein n=1 Tax=Dictyobacter vulcani TaxID=2607529 RepID=A0A5J4KZT7_9CHLR|nr:hypothetical protein KDW_49080 [Dictyobacter vulcani]
MRNEADTFEKMRDMDVSFPDRNKNQQKVCGSWKPRSMFFMLWEYTREIRDNYPVNILVMSTGFLYAKKE